MPDRETCPVKLQPSDSRSGRWWLRLLFTGWCVTGACWLSRGNSTQDVVRLPLTLFSDNFTTSEYYTNNTQLKSRLTGKKATPLGAERYLITQLRLELFEENGQRQLIIEAPECVYDYRARNASSAGPLKIVLGEGRLSVTGEGFLWQQAQSSLMISNRVYTRLRDLPKSKNTP